MMKRNEVKQPSRFKQWAMKRVFEGRHDPISCICRFFMAGAIIRAYNEVVKENNEFRTLKQMHGVAVADLDALITENANLKRKVNQHTYDLERQRDGILAKVVKMLNVQKPDTESIQQLRGNWSIWTKEAGSVYCLTTGYCMLGGCDHIYIEFTTWLSAFLYASLLDSMGIKATSNLACDSCYAEYCRDTM